MSLIKVHYKYDWNKNIIKLTNKKTGKEYITHIQEVGMTEYIVGPKVFRLFKDNSFELDWQSPDYGISDDWECQSFPKAEYIAEYFSICPGDKR